MYKHSKLKNSVNSNIYEKEMELPYTSDSMSSDRIRNLQYLHYIHKNSFSQKNFRMD